MGPTRDDAHECSYDLLSRFSAKNRYSATLVPLADFMGGLWQTFQPVKLNGRKTSFFIGRAGARLPNSASILKLRIVFVGKRMGQEHISRASLFEYWAFDLGSFARSRRSIV
jgi:hypothetical protein